MSDSGNGAKRTKIVGFDHGALCDPYEEQANAQGFTLGDKAKLLQDLGHHTVMIWIHGLLTDSQYDAALKKLQKQLVKALKPIDTMGEGKIAAGEGSDVSRRDD